MRELLIVETRDADEHRGPERMVDLAAGMVSSGVPSTIFLTENAAFAARRRPEGLAASAIAAGVSVAVDHFALQERAITETELESGVDPSSIDMVIEHLSRGNCVLWR
jgi:predicted peroxiredoxin